MEERYDFLVIGSGAAGITFALEAANHGKVCIISKTNLEECNTKYAQGGIAAVTYSPDDFEKHVKDTLICGDGLCNEDIVRLAISEAPAAIQRLIDLGTNFDKDQSGKYDLAREGGHNENRILHHKDVTGAEIERALVARIRKNPNITILENHFAIDIITQHHLGMLVKRYYNSIECYGAYVLDTATGKVKTILAKATLMATGGTGNVYHTTTNPVVATGDGVAMVSRAKGIIEDMEFVQFHPTALYSPSERPEFLITEALRGFGAILKDQNGNEFMQKYDSRGSLAPRDIVARAIDSEMKIAGIDYVYLDARHISYEQLMIHFPNIYKKCMSVGIDMTKDYIPVAPAAHFSCGGIKVDKNGLSWIKNLYAAGEAACTGLHGANRLASNSLMEAVVFSYRAAIHATENCLSSAIPENIPAWNDEGTTSPEEMILITQSMRELQQIMTNYVAIVRSDLRLQRAEKRVNLIMEETQALYKKLKVSRILCELRNLTEVSYLIIKSASQRKTSAGLHYNVDYPKKKSLS